MNKWTNICVTAFVFFSVLSDGKADQNLRVSKVTVDQNTIRSTIPVIRTDSGNSQVRSPERLRHKARAVAKPPPPLSSDKYVGLTGQHPPPKPGTATDLHAPEKPRLDYLQLTIRHNYSGFGWLDLNEIRHIDAKTNSAQFYTATDPVMAWTRAHLKVEAGERYLVDFSVAASQKTTFSVGGQSFSVNKGSHHLLLYLDAKSTTTQLMTLTSDNANYVFYSLDVTRVDQG